MNFLQMYPKKLLYDANDNSLCMVHRDLKQLDDCIEAAHSSELNRFSSNKLECNWNKTQRILLILSYNREYQSVKLIRFNIDKFDWKIRITLSIRQYLEFPIYCVWKLKKFVVHEYLRVDLLCIL